MRINVISNGKREGIRRVSRTVLRRYPGICMTGMTKAMKHYVTTTHPLTVLPVKDLRIRNMSNNNYITT